MRSADGLIVYTLPCPRSTSARCSRVLNLVRCAQHIPFALPNPLVVVIARGVLFFHVANDLPPPEQRSPVRANSQQVRAEVGGSLSYDVEVTCAGAAGDDGRPVLVGNGVLRQKLEDAQFNLNLLHQAPPDTDLENDCMHGCQAESSRDSSVWARTSLEAFLDLVGEVRVHLAAAVRYKLTPTRPGHLVILGPDGFHLCSCLKLLRLGLLCRHYFAVLVRFLGGNYRGVLLNHEFDGASVHARWRRSFDGNDEP